MPDEASNQERQGPNATLTQCANFALLELQKLVLLITNNIWKLHIYSYFGLYFTRNCDLNKFYLGHKYCHSKQVFFLEYTSKDLPCPLDSCSKL